MSKRPSLSSVLSKAAHGQGSAKLQSETQSVSGANPATAKAHRAGKVNVTGYFDPTVKQSIRLIQSKHPDRTLQDLLAEALNDLFAKYNVPQSARLDR